jgi:hypothetical protein
MSFEAIEKFAKSNGCYAVMIENSIILECKGCSFLFSTMKEARAFLAGISFANYGKKSKETFYDWDNVEEIYNWVATDFSGQVYAYQNKPYIDRGRFVRYGHYKLLISQRSHPHWEESLEERPI